MPIGNGPDYYDGVDRIKEEQLRLQEKVDKWWYDLEDNYKYELIDPDKDYFMSADAMWNGLDWNDKWDIYTGEHDEVPV